MALTGLHSNWLTGSYAGDREYILRATENNELFRSSNVPQNLRAHFDGNNSIAFGYGLDLLVNNDATINSYLTAAGLAPLTSQDANVLAQARTYRNAQLASGQPVNLTNFVNQLSLDLLTDANARALLNAVASDKEVQVIRDLSDGGMGPNEINALLGTRELVALVSLTFNGVPSVVRDSNGNYVRNTRMLDAILEGSRAEAWYEIRYNSNGNNLSGLAKRRFFEADTFGLYSAGVNAATILEDDARSIFRMYANHRNVINVYENRYGQNGTNGDMVSRANQDYGLTADQVHYWPQESQIARDFLVSTYAQFSGAPVVSGEVLVGSSLGEFDSLPGNDLLLGEARYNNLHGQGGADIVYGNIVADDLYGDAGNDVLFGESGNDALSGGTDDDRLEGGDEKKNGDILHFQAA